MIEDIYRPSNFKRHFEQNRIEFLTSFYDQKSDVKTFLMNKFKNADMKHITLCELCMMIKKELGYDIKKT